MIQYLASGEMMFAVKEVDSMKGAGPEEALLRGGTEGAGGTCRDPAPPSPAVTLAYVRVRGAAISADVAGRGLLGPEG